MRRGPSFGTFGRLGSATSVTLDMTETVVGPSGGVSMPMAMEQATVSAVAIEAFGHDLGDDHTEGVGGAGLHQPVAAAVHLHPDPPGATQLAEAEASRRR